MLNRLRTKRTAWYATASSIPVTAALLAFGGGHLNTFMFWFLTIGFTTTTVGRLWFWWKTSQSSTDPLIAETEAATAPQINGDSRLPSGAFFG